MEREFYPEALEDWSKGCAGCVAREELNIAFVTLDEACKLYNIQLCGVPHFFTLRNKSDADYFYSTQSELYNFVDWNRRLAERHRLSDLAVVLLYYLAEQYGDLGEHLRDGVAASDEYIQYALDGAASRAKAFAKLKQAHSDLCNALIDLAGRPSSMPASDTWQSLRKDIVQSLQIEFSKLESAYADVVAKTATVWENLLPYQKNRAAQAFKISISGK